MKNPEKPMYPQKEEQEKGKQPQQHPMKEDQGQQEEGSERQQKQPTQ